MSDAIHKDTQDVILRLPCGFYLTRAEQWDAPGARVTLRRETPNRNRRICVLWPLRRGPWRLGGPAAPGGLR